jgi:hypothetical protein
MRYYFCVLGHGREMAERCCCVDFGKEAGVDGWVGEDVEH